MLRSKINKDVIQVIFMVVFLIGFCVFMVTDLTREAKEKRAFMQKCIDACRPQAVAETQKSYNNCVCDNTKKSVEVK